MRFTDADLISKKYFKFNQKSTNSITGQEKQQNFDDSFGGIIQNGQFGWLSTESNFEIFKLTNGEKIGSCDFNKLGFGRTIVTTVCEIEIPNSKYCLLGIGLQFCNSPGSIIAIYSSHESKLIRCIEIPAKVTACHYVDYEITKRTILQTMQGCLAVGTDSGKIILIDLNLDKCKEELLKTNYNVKELVVYPCHLVQSKIDFNVIRKNYKFSTTANLNFGIELEVIQPESLVLSILAVSESLSLAVGLENGRMILYDLCELHPFHMAHPPEGNAPLVKLAFIEPADDPRACYYLWALHENSCAVLHCVMYFKKLLDDEIYLFEDFQSCQVRLSLPMFDNNSIPIACQTITKRQRGHLYEQDTISICLMAWKSDGFTQVLVFDLNQWYKEQMPTFGDYRKNLNYLVHFTLRHCQPFGIHLDFDSISLFNSIQRSEEHFYANALCFDFVVLIVNSTSVLHWPGLQNRVINLLNTSGSLVFLEPNGYFKELVNASILPQFCDYNYNTTITTNAQREILLSAALENNCFGLLTECARNWADGSHLGVSPMDGLSLSTLTDWIWQRAGQMKTISNKLSIPLFDHSGYRINEREQKQLLMLARQFKLLANLLDIILTEHRDNIPNEIFDHLKSQYNSIKRTSEYQEILQWLLNIGLLPEGPPYNSQVSDTEDDNSTSMTSSKFVSYPYQMLKHYYSNQRLHFHKLNKNLISARTQSCRALYIDSFIEHECNPIALREEWMSSGGNGLYPPSSLQAMLRTLLVPDIPIEKKYVIFVYFFLDLNMAIDDDRYSGIIQNLIKFPAVFKLNASTIKTVQAFWNLDHCQYEAAIEEIISPFSQDKKLLRWQHELLVETLLTQEQHTLALRALQIRSSPINCMLEIKTLMANDLIAEAYHLAKSKKDMELMRTFFSSCLYLGKWCILRNLALNEQEEKLIEELLKQSKSSIATNLHFIYLIQKSKYIEALSYLDELTAMQRSKHHDHNKTIDLETPQLILSAYSLTMTPATKSLSDSYYKTRTQFSSAELNKFNNENSPKPLSCQLLQQNANNLVGGIYQSAANSIDLATNYWECVSQDSNRLMDTSNAPFIRRPQQSQTMLSIQNPTVSYPEPYKPTPKRRSEDYDGGIIDINSIDSPAKRTKIFESNESKHSLFTSQRTMKPINSTLLTKFKERTPYSAHSLFDRSNLNVTPQNIENNMNSVSAIILDTPIVNTTRPVSSIGQDEYDRRLEGTGTPLSILNMKNLIRANASSIDGFNIEPVFPKTLTDSDSVSERSMEFVSPSKSEITQQTTAILKSPTKCGERSTCTHIGLGYSCPKKRKPIRSTDSSLISGTDEFFSPISSLDNSQINSQNNSVLESQNVFEEMNSGEPVEKTTEITDTEITDTEITDTEMVTDSVGDTGMPSDILGSKSFAKLPSYHYRDGPKQRRPLSRSSKAPSESNLSPDRDQKPINKSQLGRSTRSKTPDILLSPSRRSTRLASRINREKTPERAQSAPLLARASSQKPLSRIVLESNALKTVTTSVFNEKTVTITEETFESIERADTNSFQPSVSSSKVAATTSYFGQSNKPEDNTAKRTPPGSEHTTIDGEISLVDISPEHLAAPAPFLSSDYSMASDGLISGQISANHSLLTTMDMSNVSGNYTMFAAPSNILLDSSSEENATGNRAEDAIAENRTEMEIDVQVEEEVQLESVVQEEAAEEQESNVQVETQVQTEAPQRIVEADTVQPGTSEQREGGEESQKDSDSSSESSTGSDEDSSTSENSGENGEEESATQDANDEDNEEAESENEVVNDENQDPSAVLNPDSVSAENTSTTSAATSSDSTDTTNTSSASDSNSVINISSSSSEFENPQLFNDQFQNQNPRPNAFPANVYRNNPGTPNPYCNNPGTPSPTLPGLRETPDREISDLLYGDIDEQQQEDQDYQDILMDGDDDMNDAHIFSSTSGLNVEEIEAITADTTEMDYQTPPTAGNNSDNMNFLTGEKDIDDSLIANNSNILNVACLEGTSTTNDLTLGNVNDQSMEETVKIQIIQEPVQISYTSDHEMEEQSLNKVDDSDNPLNLPIVVDVTAIDTSIDTSTCIQIDESNLDTTVELADTTNEIDTTVEGEITDVSINVLNLPISDISTSIKTPKSPLLPDEKEIEVEIVQKIEENIDEPIEEKIDKNITENVEKQIKEKVEENVEEQIKEKVEENVEEQIKEKSEEQIKEKVEEKSEEQIKEKVEENSIEKIQEQEEQKCSTVENVKENTVEITNKLLSDDEDINLKVSDDEMKITDQISIDNIHKSKTNISIQNKREIVTEEIPAELLENSTKIQSKTNTETDFNTPRNIARAVSVPRTTEISQTPKRKLRQRAESTDNVRTPNTGGILTRRKSQLLEAIEETTTLNSPACNTRSRALRQSIDSDNSIQLGTPTYSTKRRRLSLSVVSLPDTETTPQTPKTSRARSVVSDDNIETTFNIQSDSGDKSPMELTPLSDNLDNKMNLIKRKVPPKKDVEKLTKVSASDINEAEAVESYSGNRRLTRTQKSMMEKSMNRSMEKNTVPNKKKTSVSSSEATSHDDGEPSSTKYISDTESVQSQRSKKSTTSTITKRITRSTRSLDDDIDTKSIASSQGSVQSRSPSIKTPRKKKTVPIADNLEVIQEENVENEGGISDNNDASTSAAIPARKTKPRAKKEKK